VANSRARNWARPAAVAFLIRPLRQGISSGSALATVLQTFKSRRQEQDFIRPGFVVAGQLACLQRIVVYRGCN
jgi:hypothetical protein